MLIWLDFNCSVYSLYNLSISIFLDFREYAKLLVSCGLIGEAIKIFEDLELWDNLIYCNWYDVIDNHYPNLSVYLSLSLSFVLLMGVGFVYDVKNSLLGKKAAAVELIKARLSEKPNDPRLWFVDEPFL